MQRVILRAAVLRTVLIIESVNALEIIDETEGEFDIIYNDIDKDGYPEAFHKAIPRLRSGGLFITDNMIWGGRVVTQEPGDPPEGLDEREQWFSHQPQSVSES